MRFCMSSGVFCLMLLGGAYCLAEESPKLSNHQVVLGAQGELLPWTSYDRVLRGSVEFLKNCPTHKTKLGKDPWYLITSKLTEKCDYMENQNNQGGNAYWAVEMLARYYAYSGDREAFKVVRTLLDRVMQFHTPADWVWPNVPRTQDNSPDGRYTDSVSEVDKLCMAGDAYLRFSRMTGDAKYRDAALLIAEVVGKHVADGDADHSPLPFRVNLKNGKILDPYTSNVVAGVVFYNRLVASGLDKTGQYAALRDRLWKWIIEYPVKNQRWSGYFEDVGPHPENMNQYNPLETVRYMLDHPDQEPRWRTLAPPILTWVEERFGHAKRFGAVSISEQDCCFKEMSSHTARFASVLARWYGLTGDVAARDKALGSFALSTYSAFNEYSKKDRAMNYVGLGYLDPWFSDSYFDYIPHFLYGMAEIPQMAPENENHLLGSTDMVLRVDYGKNRIAYQTLNDKGEEIFRLCKTPTQVLEDGTPMETTQWVFESYHGVEKVLQINRTGAREIVIEFTP